MATSRRTKLAFTDGVTPAVDCSAMFHVSVYLVGDGGVISAGVVTVQTCDWLPAPATAPPEAAWKSLAQTINAADATLGAQGFVQLTAGAYSLVRLKVTTPLVGAGTVTGVVVQAG